MTVVHPYGKLVATHSFQKTPGTILVYGVIA